MKAALCFRYEVRLFEGEGSCPRAFAAAETNGLGSFRQIARGRIQRESPELHAGIIAWKWRQFGFPTHMYMMVSVPLDCVSVKVVAVVCTRTVAIAEVSLATHTGAEL